MQRKNINTLKALGATTIVGIVLWLYYQPVCEPCLPGEYCPPCRAPEQYYVAAMVATIDVALLGKIVLSLFRNHTPN